ncbi:unnamed protein product [Durusdinium trenchii]|uniref:EF-hand domain-containing protein n=1 Tax=Durusdinium trenchii TaxID=1381693 RepID=A0ABP0LLA0_9DINO
MPRQVSQDTAELCRAQSKQATLGSMPPRQVSQDSAGVFHHSASLHLPEVSRSSELCTAERSSSRQSVSSVTSEHDPRSKRLSFIDCSIDDLDELILAESEGADWFKDFWGTVLTQQPVCRALSNRSLVNWVAIYNRWQAAGKWTGQAPEYLNSYELQEWLAAPLTRVLELVKLFDPAGHGKVSMTKAPQDHYKVKVPVLPLMSACLVMSQTMSNRQKLRFLLGMFDLDDKGSLSMREFASMLENLLRGLGCLFKVKEIPRTIATAARSIFEQFRGGTVPMHELEMWFSGKTFHPFAVPFALLLQRFSADSQIIDPDSYNDDSRKFKLSHQKPVEEPLESFAVQDNAFLNRSEVVIAREVFQYCLSTGFFSLSHEDAEKGIGKPIDVDIWCKRMSRALEEANTIRGSGARFDFKTFLKKLCPKATNTHLHMFDCWLQEFDKLQEQKACLERTRQMSARFKEYRSQPMLSERMRNELKTSFNVVDRSDCGRVTTVDLQVCMEVERCTAKSMMRYFDVNGDGFVDLEEYIAAMCPPGYRMPSDVKDNIFDVLLSAQVSKEEELVAQKEAFFEGKASPGRRAKDFIRKQVPDEVWNEWNTAWETLDKSHLGYLNCMHLKQSRALPADMCDFMFNLIAEDAEGDKITKHQFLTQLLESSGFRFRNGISSE